jgi:L-alanine-DL-glutamate epimerase-like enolase superfamily enzyme
VLGGAARATLVPYASLLPEGGTLVEYRESLMAKAREAVCLGFRAIKIEVCVKGPYAHMGLQEPDGEIVDMVGAVRETVGRGVSLMVDVAYAWRDYTEALSICANWSSTTCFSSKPHCPPTTWTATHA